MCAKRIYRRTGVCTSAVYETSETKLSRECRLICIDKRAEIYRPASDDHGDTAAAYDLYVYECTSTYVHTHTHFSVYKQNVYWSALPRRRTKRISVLPTDPRRALVFLSPWNDKYILITFYSPRIARPSMTTVSFRLPTTRIIYVYSDLSISAAT